MAGSGAMYLRTRNLSWDQWSQAAAELGWLCCGLDAGDRFALGPRGMGNVVDLGPAAHLDLHPVDDLFGLPDPAGAVGRPSSTGRLSAVFAVIGTLDVPLVIVAAHWFRGIHPSTVAMEPAMRTVLWLSVAGFTALFGVLLAWRRSRLQSTSRPPHCANDRLFHPTSPTANHRPPQCGLS